MFSLLFNLSLFPTDFQTLRFVPLNSTSFLFIKFPHPVLIQMVKRLPTMWETQVRSLGCEDPLEKEMPTHSSSIAWNIPWTEDPGRLQSMGSQSRTRLSDFTFTLEFLIGFVYPLFQSTLDFSTCLVNTGVAMGRTIFMEASNLSYLGSDKYKWCLFFFPTKSGFVWKSELHELPSLYAALNLWSI